MNVLRFPVRGNVSSTVLQLPAPPGAALVGRVTATLRELDPEMSFKVSLYGRGFTRLERTVRAS